MKKLLSILCVILSFQFAIAQPASDVLMTIGDEEVGTDEFLRIYNKNSSIALEEKKSIEEYLDLFINYKLKVIEAENLGYDTASAFIKEMDGYTKQLAKPYLDKSSVLDSFVREAYRNYQEEVNASHILLRIDRNALPKDTVRVYNRIMEIREEIINGKNWNQAIIDNSPSPDKEIGGDLGWFGAFRMVYPFEVAAYNTKVGEVSMPVRTSYGYHLIKVNDRRPNRGEVDVRHIMTLVPRNNPTEVEIEAARKKIEEAYAALMKGADWDSITREYSEHKTTLSRGGKLGWIRSGNAPEKLLDVCFELEPGQMSEVFRSEYGFHIAIVDDYKPVQSFEEVEADFRSKIKQTNDINRISKEQRLRRIKEQYGYQFSEKSMEGLYEVIDTTLYTGDWDPETAKDMQEVVFSIGDSVYTQYDVAKEVGKRRLAYRGVKLEVSIRNRAIKFADEKVLEYEIAQLPKKYPEYGYLLDEYHDGILLFNLTEDRVWRKAVEDSAGLEAFYNSLPEKYEWEERMVLSKYTLPDSLDSDKLIKLAKKKEKKGLDAKAMSLILCGQDTIPCIKLEEYKYEKGDNAVADGMEWKKGSYQTSAENGEFVLYYVDKILPPKTKKLTDARGLYTADYQSYLEDKWVKQLREKYEISINQEVLSKLIQQESEK
jgi:peptidyl-prolyl cis-trans isomerase SurA